MYGYSESFWHEGIPDCSKQSTVALIFQHFNCLIWQGSACPLKALKASLKVDEFSCWYRRSQGLDCSSCTLDGGKKITSGENCTLTGRTSRPIPSAGIIPILRDFLVVVAIERKGALNAITLRQYSQSWMFVVKHWRVSEYSPLFATTRFQHRGSRSTIRGHVVSTITYTATRRTGLTFAMVESITLSQRNHQCVLLNSTNLLPQTQGHSLPTPPDDVPSKRRPPTPDETRSKRPRLARPNGGADDGDTEIKSNAHRHTMFSLLQRSSRRPPSSFPRIIRMYLSLVAWMYITHRSLSSVQSTFALYTTVLCILTQI